MFGRDDALALRISQPLRVEAGGLNLNVPVAWSYASETATRGVRTIALSPSGREIVSELAWRGSLAGGYARASAYWRQNPGHRASLPMDKGVAMSWSREF